jgi:hypothetical protein
VVDLHALLERADEKVVFVVGADFAGMRKPVDVHLAVEGTPAGIGGNGSS